MVYTFIELDILGGTFMTSVQQQQLQRIAEAEFARIRFTPGEVNFMTPKGDFVLFRKDGRWAVAAENFPSLAVKGPHLLLEGESSPVDALIQALHT